MLINNYDFTRCVRADGTAYGTRGKCKLGREEQLSALEKKKLKVLSGKIQKAEERVDKTYGAYRSAKFKNRGKVSTKAMETLAQRLRLYESNLTSLKEEERKVKGEIEKLKGGGQRKVSNKTPKKESRYSRLSSLLEKINDRAKKIIEKHGRDSSEFEVFRKKYAPISKRVNEQLETLSPFS